MKMDKKKQSVIENRQCFIPQTRRSAEDPSLKAEKYVGKENITAK